MSAGRGKLGDLELAAIYLAGLSPVGMQYHVQLSVLSDRNPARNAQKSERYAPDVVATASLAQLQSSTNIWLRTEGQMVVASEASCSCRRTSSGTTAQPKRTSGEKILEKEPR